MAVQMEEIMKRLVVAALLVTTIAVPAHAQVRVGIDIGIQLPAPPVLVAIPEVPVYYAPRAPANVFFYAHQYWAFAKDGWYVGPSWSGPWVVVEPAHVPMPILQVPVRYYSAPPSKWKEWRREAPPQWSAAYGREWREASYERGWREHEEQWNRSGGKGCPPGLAKQGRC